MLTQEVERELEPHRDQEAALTPFAFRRLLEWLDDGVESHGETYLEMRRRLVAYFDRRDRPAADSLADETFNRIARTLERDGAIATRPPARYCYVVARFVLLEDVRHARRSVPFDGRRAETTAQFDRVPAEEAASRERRLGCLDRCLVTLKPDHRELVIEYYRDAKSQRIERRREMAARLGITMNALAIRLSRIRSTLERCVGACSREPLKGFRGVRPTLVEGRE